MGIWVFWSPKYPKFKQKCIVWSIVEVKWMIRYVSYNQSIDTTDISQYNQYTGLVTSMDYNNITVA